MGRWISVEPGPACVESCLEHTRSQITAVQQVRGQDPNSARVCARGFSPVSGWVRAFCASDREVGDLAHEAFLVAGRKLSGFDGRKSAGSALPNRAVDFDQPSALRVAPAARPAVQVEGSHNAVTSSCAQHKARV